MTLRMAPETPKGRTTRSQILEAAVKIASREGLGGLTIGELAKAVGMSKSGLFAHFKGKDTLQLEVLQAAVDRFIDAVMRPAFQEPPGEPRLMALLNHWLKFIDGSDSQPGGSILIAASIELDDRPGPLRDFVQRAQQELITNIEKAARIAVEQKHFRTDLDCEQFAWSLYSFVLGYHHFSRMLEDPQAERRLRRSVAGLFQVARGQIESERGAKRKPRGSASDSQRRQNAKLGASPTPRSRRSSRLTRSGRRTKVKS